MAERTEYPRIITKRKNIQVIIDFCLDESIVFTVRQQQFPDTDWIVELNVTDIKTAILLGMFVRENKFEIEGVDASKLKKQPTASAVAAAPTKKAKVEEKPQATSSLLNDVETSDDDESKEEDEDAPESTGFGFASQNSLL